METFNIDTAILVGFLAINLFAGLYSGKNIKTIKEYAIGTRNFSTATIAATIVATWMAGSNMAITVSETYNKGLYYVIPGLADGISFFIIAYFYAPRMAEFLGNLSVAEAMGNLYGNRVRTITSITAIVIGIGNVAVQFAVSIVLLNHFLGISSIYAAIISCFIVILYSTFGGIKSVTFTDIIQFFTFCITIPMTAFFIWQTLDSNQAILDVFTKSTLFDYKEFFSYHNPNFLSTLLLFLFFVIPGLDPVIFQRISIAKNTNQVFKSFTIAGFIMMFLEYGVIAFCGVLLLASNTPGLNEDNIVNHILDNYISTGFKGFFIVGIVAMIMSTADSYINSSAVLFSYDFVKSIGVELTEKKQLVLVRIAALVIGVLALLLGLLSNNLLELILSAYSFYMPIVSVPLILAIFGFRSSSKAVLIGMLAGFITVISFKLFSDINGLIPGMISNMMFFIGSHYILREQGGWIGIKDNAPLNSLRLERKRKFNRFIQSVKNFNMFKFCQSNSPKEESIFVCFGLFSIIIVFSNAFSLPRIFYQEYNFLNIIYYPQLIVSVIFITYSLWREKFKDQEIVQNVISLMWVSGIFYLIFISNLLLILNNFAQIQFTILMATLITVAILLRWQFSLFLLVIGMICSTQFYKFYLNLESVQEHSGSLQFKVIYSLLLFSSILIAFLKPKQQRQELTQQRADYLGKKVHDIDEELKKSVEVKNEFLRNLEHEAHTPIVGITTMGQVLFENYDKLTEEQRRKGLKEISKSSERLSTLVNNMIDVSKLSSLNYVLNKTLINLSDLIYQRLDHCKKLYLENKDLEFICDIEGDLLVNCDEHYITSTLDNLIVNAITYSKDGRITIEFKKNNDLVKFKITDEGIGIPQKELYAIFGTFTVSSKTKTPAGGRGLGLALCKGTIEAHKGQIWCKSNGKKGSTFTFTLPIEESIKLIEARLTKSELQKQK